MNYILEKSLLCQIRHLGKKYECSVKKNKENLFYVDTKEKVRAPAPGQSLVFFDNEKCLGGGIITND
jgi:tRNA-specific 2-thiouridylase